jgi:predicted DNA-binding transcriptional regulator YafY
VPRHSPQWDRLRDGWNGVVIASTATTVDVKVEVDEPAESKVAVLLLQLGPECSVVSPPSVLDAVRAIARRLVAAHS